MFWFKNHASEAQNIWKFGKELGFSITDEEDGVLNSLQFMEARD